MPGTFCVLGRGGASGAWLRLHLRRACVQRGRSASETAVALRFPCLRSIPLVTPPTPASGCFALNGMVVGSPPKSCGRRTAERPGCIKKLPASVHTASLASMRTRAPSWAEVRFYARPMVERPGSNRRAARPFNCSQCLVRMQPPARSSAEETLRSCARHTAARLGSSKIAV